MTIKVGFLLFPNVQQLDLIGPYDVFASVAGISCYLIWKDCQPLKASSGLVLTPDMTFTDCPQLDVLCIPGGLGIGALMNDTETLDFIRRQAHQARFVTAVCTGSLVLGAAGLLRGRRATTHWAYHDLLPLLGAIPVQQRVVKDGSLVTGGGVTAGIDFAFTLITELLGEVEAQSAQLFMEYAPEPPFNAGSPSTAPQAIVEHVKHRLSSSLEMRRKMVTAAARLL